MRRPLERVRELVDDVEGFRQLVDEAGRLVPTEPEPSPDGSFLATVAALRERFETAMDDDFNTPQAIGVLNLLATALGEERERVRTGIRSGQGFVTGVSILIDLGQVLGLSMKGHRSERAQVFEPERRAHIDDLVEKRKLARERRDWTQADALRAELDALGVAVEDTPAGPKWKLKARTGP
jgi:cysteinyl-tRNA synthetase